MMKMTPELQVKKQAAIAARHELREALAEAGLQSGRALMYWDADRLAAMGERITKGVAAWKAAEETFEKEAQQ